MSWTVKKSTGRWWLAGLVLVGGLTSAWRLWHEAAGGAIHAEAVWASLAQLGGVYAPLFALMGGFLWAEGRRRKEDAADPPPALGFFVAVAVIALWSFAPTGILLFTDYVEDFQKYVKGTQAIGNSIGALAISFYFAR